MRLVVLANNWVGWRIAEEIAAGDDSIVGLSLHPQGKRAYGDEIRDACGVAEEAVIDGARINDPEAVDRLVALQPDLVVSLFFGYLLKPRLLSRLSCEVINLHPSYLPHNRGAYPNVWSILDGTPAGVTLHRIDAGVDTGDVYARRSVAVEPVDTGETLYRKLEHAAVHLFRETWPLLKAGELTPVSQSGAEGSCHRRSDVDRIDRIDLDRDYNAGELINLLRARTFGRHPGAYFLHEGRRVNVRVELEYDYPTDENTDKAEAA